MQSHLNIEVGSNQVAVSGFSIANSLRVSAHFEFDLELRREQKPLTIH